MVMYRSLVVYKQSVDNQIATAKYITCLHVYI